MSGIIAGYCHQHRMSAIVLTVVYDSSPAGVAHKLAVGRKFAVDMSSMKSISVTGHADVIAASVAVGYAAGPSCALTVEAGEGRKSILLTVFASN